MKRSMRSRQTGTLSTTSVPAIHAAREFIIARDSDKTEGSHAPVPQPFRRDARSTQASADAIMARVRQVAEEAESRASHPARHHASGLRVAMFAVAAVLVAALSSIATIGIVGASATVEVRFVLSAPEASSVMLAADFNQWTTDGYALKRGPDGHWEITVPLQKGKSYAYNFVIDGERWIVDPSTASRLDDGFGGSSSSISL
jgi:hypothetical protein